MATGKVFKSDSIERKYRRYSDLYDIKQAQVEKYGGRMIDKKATFVEFSSALPAVRNSMKKPNEEAVIKKMVQKQATNVNRHSVIAFRKTQIIRMEENEGISHEEAVSILKQKNLYNINAMMYNPQFYIAEIKKRNQELKAEGKTGKERAAIIYNEYFIEESR